MHPSSEVLMMLVLLWLACAETRSDYVTCEDAWCLACRLCPDEAAVYVDCDAPPVRPDVGSWAFAMGVCGWNVGDSG